MRAQAGRWREPKRLAQLALGDHSNRMQLIRVIAHCLRNRANTGLAEDLV